MTIREGIPLAFCTTLKVGGPAAYLAECGSTDDVSEALAFAKEKGLPWKVIGEGSNLLAADEGFPGVVLRMRIPGMSFDENAGDIHATVGAGVLWDAFVREVASRNLWGVENLAGIPGTVGAAPIQNIGAYGAELSDTLLFVETFNADTGNVARLSASECDLAYRDSRFKREPNRIVLRVGFLLSQTASPRLSYQDLALARERDVPLATPADIGNAVRHIRAEKFPDLSQTGTAGSFFKNPIVSLEVAALLKEKHPGLPVYPAASGAKVSLAWLFDHVLGLKGYGNGAARLFERQPIVITTDAGASARDVETLANDVARRVEKEIGVRIEREVRSIP